MTQTAFEQARRRRSRSGRSSGTRRSQEAAIRSDDTPQIQRLATVEGQEIGQLADIRSTAVAKVYKTLMPDQKTQATALEQLLMPEHTRAAS